jgi:hypothetical protein
VEEADAVRHITCVIVCAPFAWADAVLANAASPSAAMSETQMPNLRRSICG